MSDPKTNKTTYNSVAAKVELAVIAGDLHDQGMHDHANMIDAIILTHMNRAKPGLDQSRLVTGDKIRAILRAYGGTDESIEQMADRFNLYPTDVERITSRAVSTGMITKGGQ